MRTKRFVLIAVAVAGLSGTTIAVAQAANALRGGGDRTDVVTMLVAAAPTEQQPQLKDDQVTAPERQAAAERTIQCLKDQGISVELTPDRGPGQFRFGGGTPTEQARANAIYQDCYERFEREIDMVYSVQQPPLSASESASAEQRLLTCLQEAGVDVSLSAPKDVWWDIRLTSPTEFARCGNAVIAEFGALP